MFWNLLLSRRHADLRVRFTSSDGLRTSSSSAIRSSKVLRMGGNAAQLAYR